MLDLPDRSVVIACGTRPEAVKLLGVVALLGPAARVVHTGQHFTAELASSFHEEIGFPAPDVQLAVGGMSRGGQIGEALRLLDSELQAHPAVAVVVQGDTNTTVAGALAANANEVPLIHVEAGLRSFDRRMPEEHNRVVVDHLADLCCAPTAIAAGNLEAEGIAPERVTVTGNTVVEAVEALRPSVEAVEELLAQRGLTRGSFVLSTFHRPENVDDHDVLATILEELARLPLPVVLPLHPRTAERARTAGLGALLERLRVEPPAGYAAFLGLASASALLISDSGGVQEEASVLKRPVVVVRRSTERPEVLGTFSELVPPGPGIHETACAWLDELPALHARLESTSGPYGDGSASRRTVTALRELLG